MLLWQLLQPKGGWVMMVCCCLLEEEICSLYGGTGHFKYLCSLGNSTREGIGRVICWPTQVP